MTGRYQCHSYQCSFIYKTMSQFLEILFFWPRYLGKHSLCPWNQPHFLRNSDKSILSPRQNKSETWLCRQTTAEDNNHKRNISPNIPCTFLLFKASAFVQIFFLRNLLFLQVLRSVFLNSKCLTFPYLFISLLKNIH